MTSPLPQGVGPHEGRELSLMRAGEKHVALFFEVEPEALNDFLADGFVLLKFRQFVFMGTAFFTWILYRDGYATDALRLKDLLQDGSHGFIPEREHEIGRILSYTPDQVEAFLRHINR